MMGDVMDGVEHGSRRIAKPKSRKPLVKATKKRKSAGGSTESGSATSLNPTPSKKARISSAVAVVEPEQSWNTASYTPYGC